MDNVRGLNTQNYRKQSVTGHRKTESDPQMSSTNIINIKLIEGAIETDYFSKRS